MFFHTTRLRKSLLAGAAAAALFANGAVAQDEPASKHRHRHADTVAARLARLEQLIAEQQAEIHRLKAEIGHEQVATQSGGATQQLPAAEASNTQVRDVQAQVDDLKRAQAPQYADVKKDDGSSAKVSIDNGHPTIQSRDGQFSATLHGLAQADAAYYMQSHSRDLPVGPDLSSGVNLRRVYLGVQGKVFGDWSYLLSFDFGGSNGTEPGGRVQAAYLQYDALAPWYFRIGAYPPPAGLEDSTAPQDTIFLERTAPSDAMRNTAGGDGRDAASLIYAGDRIFGALSLTDGKVGDGPLFDEQVAGIGRITGVAYSAPDSMLALSAEGAWVFKGADSSPSTDSAEIVTLSAPPELTVDSTGTKLVSTGSLDISNVKEWGLEAGGYWQSLFFQGGWFGYDVDQHVEPSALPKPGANFDGWYAEASWILTGESKGWNKATGAFTAPKPAQPLALDGSGWGAWEVAARYSDLDLNDNAGALGLGVPYGGVRGGEQRIWTLGLNWYPNSAIKFALDYQHIDLDRLNSAAPYQNIGQTIQTISFRSQISL